LVLGLTRQIQSQIEGEGQGVEVVRE
jgi:hypothetical protein